MDGRPWLSRWGRWARRSKKVINVELPLTLHRFLTLQQNTFLRPNFVVNLYDFANCSTFNPRRFSAVGSAIFVQTLTTIELNNRAKDRAGGFHSYFCCIIADPFDYVELGPGKRALLPACGILSPIVQSCAQRVNSAIGLSFGMDGMKAKDVPAHREAYARCLGFGEELLPGIPDEIAIDQIGSKLPRKALHVLSTVSQAWLYAIRSHQVYRARVRSNSAETLALIEYEPSADVKGIALYSMRDGSFHELPSLPDFGRLCHWKCLNGKVYVLFGYSVSKIYMLDLAGQRSSWKQCRAIEASDVVGRVVESRKRSEHGVEFMAHGRLHLMNSSGVHVQNVDGNSWTQMHSHSFPALGPIDSLSITPFDVLFVEDELLATVGWHNISSNRKKSRWGEWLFRSRGLGSASEQIMWQKAGAPLSFTSYCPSYVSFRIQPIQL